MSSSLNKNRGRGQKEKQLSGDDQSHLFLMTRQHTHGLCLIWASIFAKFRARCRGSSALDRVGYEGFRGHATFLDKIVSGNGYLFFARDSWVLLGPLRSVSYCNFLLLCQKKVLVYTGRRSKLSLWGSLS